MHDAGSSALVRDVSFIIEAWGFGIGLKILVLGCLVSMLFPFAFRLSLAPNPQTQMYLGSRSKIRKH